jgi:RNA polymerase sigma factor (sigma-70 family)
MYKLLGGEGMKQSTQEEQTDAYLVMRARADDTDAFTLLIERYQVLLICIALRSVGDKEIARDLVQEALLQAYLSLDQLRDAARFKNWLYGIVLNLCRNWVRTSKQGARALTTSLDHEFLLTYYDDTLSPDPEELFVEQELHDLVREAIHMLSPKNRTVMELFYDEGLSLLQIAHYLDITLAAVKSRIHKGRDQLRAHLKTLYPELAEMPTRKEKQTSMVTVTLAKVLNRVKTYHSRTILVLLEEQHQRALPLWFRDRQAHQSGHVQPLSQEKEIPLEPLTTDFLAQILSASETTVEEIAIDALQGEILYARVKVRSVNTTRIVKAHLNDALPLALRLNCPLAVSKEILTNRGISLADWGKTREQQIDAVAELAFRTPMMHSHSQETLRFFVPRNLNFEDGLHGWRVSGSSASGSNNEYSIHLDAQTVYSNTNSLALTLPEAETDAMPETRGVVLTHEGFLADHYRGQRIRMITHVKTQGGINEFFAIQTTGIELTPGQERATAKVRMILIGGRAFEGTQDWTRHELVFNVPDDANSIQIGYKLSNQGKVWIDGFQFELVDKSVPLTGTQQLMPPLQSPQNLDFVQELENWHIMGSFTQDYTYGIDDAATADGAVSAYLKADKAEPRGSARLVQTLSDQNYRNKRLHVSAMIKTMGVTQQAGLSVSVGSSEQATHKETSILGNTDWMRYDLTFDVPDENHAPLSFGLTLQGRGQAWMQDVHLESVETPK